MTRRVKQVIACALFAIGCGGASHTETTPTPPPPSTEAPSPPALFAGHGALVLRADAPRDQPPFYAEVSPEGIVTARCGATHLSDDGALSREGTEVARIVRVGDALGVEVSGRDLGWRIGNEAGDGAPARATMTTVSDTRFTAFAGTITPSGAQLPLIGFAPAEGNESFALAFLALVLVCDDLQP